MENQSHLGDIGARFRQLRAHFNLSKEALGKISGVSGTSIGNTEAGTHSPKAESVAAIARKLGVSLYWLLLEKGPMILPEGDDISTLICIDEPEIFGYPAAQAAELDALIKPKPIGVPMVTVDSEGRDNITLVSTKAAASYPTRYLEPEFYHDLPAFHLPLPELRNATFRAFQVVGDSMSPTFYQGGWVLARYVDFRRKSIQEGYIYVVVTRENVVIKRVLDRIQQRNTLALQSDNEEFQTYEVAIEDVLELWRVAADIGFKFPNTRFDTRRRLTGLEVDFQNLAARLEKLESSRNSST